jgi:excisionase family DNA binding protein
MLMTKQEKQKGKLITVKEVANYLVVTERTVYRLIKDPSFPAFKVGGQWRFKMELIDDWMRRDRATSHSSPEFSEDTEGLLDDAGRVAN